jgi:hypothetical protein
MWGVSLLPFIEQVQAYSLYNPNAPLPNEDATNYPPGKNKELTKMRMTIYECPSDIEIGKPRIPFVDDWPPAGLTFTPFEMYPTSYFAVGGSNSNASFVWDIQADSGATRTYLKGAFHTVTNQFSYMSGFESFSSVTDGTSNTAFFVERHGLMNYIESGENYSRIVGNWAGVPRNHIYTMSPRSVTLKAHDWKQCITLMTVDSYWNSSWTCQRSAGGYHTGGINVTLGDASVRFVSNNIAVGVGWVSATAPLNLGVWGPLCAIADGESASFP